MDDVVVRFSGTDAMEGQASLDARSFRQAALALATGKLPRHVRPEPVYIVAPTRRAWLPIGLIAVLVAAGLAALLVWLL